MPAPRVEFQGGEELGAWGERRQRGGYDPRRAGGSAARHGRSQDRQRQGREQQQQPEPRPYFWRVHQHMQASGLGGRPGAPETFEEGGWLGVAASSGEGGMMAWRRRVYEQVGADSVSATVGKPCLTFPSGLRAAWLKARCECLWRFSRL